MVDLRAGLLMCLGLSFLGGPASAADSYVYVVNATGKPLHLSVDANPSPPLDHLIAATLRVSPGAHVLAVAGDGAQGATQTVELTAEGAVVDGRARSFWCYLVGKQADGVLKIISADRPRCAELIRLGVGDRALPQDAASGAQKR